MLSPLSHPCSVVTCNLVICRLQSHVKVVHSQSTIHSACSSTFESEDQIERCETNETSSTALFFRLASNAFPDLGSVGRIKKKYQKNPKRIGVWYPSIIVVEPGNNIALQKINKDTQPEPCYEKLLQCSFFRFLSNLENRAPEKFQEC